MKVYLLSKASYDWNDPIGIFPSADAARAAVTVKEWYGADADGIEYPTIDRAQIPGNEMDAYHIREMELDLGHVDLPPSFTDGLYFKSTEG